jgi:hypothetical protein
MGRPLRADQTDPEIVVASFNGSDKKAIINLSNKTLQVPTDCGVYHKPTVYNERNNRVFLTTKRFREIILGGEVAFVEPSMGLRPRMIIHMEYPDQEIVMIPMEKFDGLV